MAGKVYFGNDLKQTWIKAPASGLKASSVGWVNEQQLLNGQTFVKRSQGSHRQFSASWVGPTKVDSLEDNLQTIIDFSNGVYGDGPFFWVDPYAADTNLFSPEWASPALSVDSDWLPLFDEALPIVQERALTSELSADVGANTQGYSPYTAVYSAAGTETLVSNTFSFYIPTGYTLWLGFHGDIDSSGGAYYTTYNDAGTLIASTKMNQLGVNSTIRVNTPISSTVANRVDVSFAKTTTSACVFKISGLIAQMLPTGVSPAAGGFISGRGTRSLKFSSFPEIQYYSANVNNGHIGMSINLVEA